MTVSYDWYRGRNGLYHITRTGIGTVRVCVVSVVECIISVGLVLGQ